VGLDEDGVDLGQVNGAVLVADGLDHGAEGEVARAAKYPFGRADDQCEGLVGEDVASDVLRAELSSYFLPNWGSSDLSGFARIWSRLFAKLPRMGRMET
jgi:hypothetical protein